jgi:hypothetical protein
MKERVMNVIELQDAIAEFFEAKAELRTGVAAKNETNEILAALGFEAIPPQMIYNYMTKKYIAYVLVDGQKRIEKAEIVRWLQKYVARKVLQAS